ncbi:hypothetical protein H2200_009321 [Cladophialophora chaetospira]|uniref:Uncharacterized protein n=1 Tax=Cladophialophora chaetospira TaxID=386627 RepID=A0AA38X402_9EURO|nr:hypothetical protein H2200_009321 [Cladophialophora chaetospira]
MSSQRKVPVAYIRGGTSKALFFHEHDVPSPGTNRDRFLRRIMGSPDPLQIDGMGGSHIVTSKIAIIKPSEKPDVDVDYTFVQVGIDNNVVGYSGNCGNISAGVGSFAIDEGLVKEKRSGVRIDPAIDTQEVIGATLNSGVLPTTTALDSTVINDISVDFTICDVGNTIVFARAQDLGILGNEKPADLDNDTALIARIKELRGKAAQKVGMCKNWELVDEQSPMLPMVALISPSTTPETHIQSRLFLDNKCHTSMAGTGAICTAACSRVTGSIVNQLISAENLQKTTLEIQHPLGQIPVVVKTRPKSNDDIPDYESLSFIRTSRRILDGSLSVPDDVKDTFEDNASSKRDHPANGIPSGITLSHESQTNGLAHRPRATTTKDYLAFIGNLRYSDLSPEVRQKLRLLFLDYIGVAAAATQLADSSTPFVKAARALNGGGTTTAIGNGQTWSASTAALLNGALAHSLDFDDTHARGCLHPGVSVISAALAEAENCPEAAVADFWTALAAGYEVTCRLGVALGTGGYSLGFHNTSTAGMFGAVAAVGKLRKVDFTTMENAFGLALSKVSGSMQYLANGSWNKRLHPGFAASDALTCVTLAEAGVSGAAEPVEGRYGLLNLFSALRGKSTKDSAGPFLDDWEFDSTAIKPYPACRMTHGQIELATALSLEEQVYDVKAIVVSLSKECFAIVGEAAENKTKPRTIVDAQFSSFYQTAVAWLYGSQLGWTVYDFIDDPRVGSLMEKIKVNVNKSYIGLESSIRVEWLNGKVREEALRNPIGEPENPITWTGAKTKFLSLAIPVYGEKRANAICAIIPELDAHGLKALMDLVK